MGDIYLILVFLTTPSTCLIYFIKEISIECSKNIIFDIIFVIDYHVVRDIVNLLAISTEIAEYLATHILIYLLFFIRIEDDF